MNRTNIEWTTFTANPLKYRDAAGAVVWGCVRHSPGCQHCYSEALAKRYGRGGPFNVQTMSGLTPFLDDGELHKMLTAKTVGGIPVAGSRCFIGDMTDIFGDWVSDDLLDRLFAVLALRSDVTWQVLTKRAARMREYFALMGDYKNPEFCPRWDAARAWLRRALLERGERASMGRPEYVGVIMAHQQWPLSNVWLGTSVEDQQRADERIPLLLQTPAAVRFISAEPLLGPLNLHQHICKHANPERVGHGFGPWCETRGDLHWVIVGGESGPGARPFDLAWARSIVQQCTDAGIACFVKQIGGQPFDSAGESLCQLENYDQWVNKARSWLGGVSGGGVRYKSAERSVCVSRAGNICTNGGDFMRARDNGEFPVSACPFIATADRKGGEPADWPEAIRVRQFPEVRA